jgi:hypothetical protein
MLPVHLWTPLWSKDRTTLVQVFRDPATGLIEAATVNTRLSAKAPWGPTTLLEDLSEGSPS